MNHKEIASRYAKAIFQVAVDNRTQEKVFSDLRQLSDVFTKDNDINQFLLSPMISPEQRVTVLTKAIENMGVSKEVTDLALMLARKNRFVLFSAIAKAFEKESDSANGVERGTVRSATTLAPAERQRIEEQVEKVLKKKVILTYSVDPSVIGGLVAQVGSYTFDDSITSHLRRMNEELKRRTV